MADNKSTAYHLDSLEKKAVKWINQNFDTFETSDKIKIALKFGREKKDEDDNTKLRQRSDAIYKALYKLEQADG